MRMDMKFTLKIFSYVNLSNKHIFKFQDHFKEFVYYQRPQFNDTRYYSIEVFNVHDDAYFCVDERNDRKRRATKNLIKEITKTY